LIGQLPLMPFDVIYLDYAKALDSVVHNKLLYKLSCYGVCDTVLDWLKDFLSSRMQCVRIESSVSKFVLLPVEFHREVFWDLYYMYCFILKILSQLNCLLMTQTYIL